MTSQNKIDLAKKLWNNAVDIKGTPAQTYLETRVPRTDVNTIPKGLRYHPKVPHSSTKSKLPCVVAPFTVYPSTEPIAILRIYLTEDGADKASVADPKMMLGPVGGGAMVLDQPAEHLIIAEGLETALSVREIVNGLTPVWAAGSAPNLANIKLPPLPLASEIKIACDHDANDVGLKAALKLARRVRQEGRTVTIIRPQQPHNDFNDVLLDAIKQDSEIYLERLSELVDEETELKRLGLDIQDEEILNGGMHLLKRDGVYKQTPDGSEWIFPYIKVIKQVIHNKGWFKVVEFYDSCGELKTEVIDCSDLTIDGKETRVQLTQAKFQAPTRKKEKELLNEYLSFSNPENYITSIKKIGWHEEGVFIMPDKIYGSEEAQGQYIVQLKPHHKIKIETKGDLKGWQQEVAHYAEGNSRLVLSIVTKLTAPLLKPLGRVGNINHLYGNSSIGKSSALCVACSVSGEKLITFQNTNNAFESVAVAHNDFGLIIDELGNANAYTIGDLVYQFTSGETKGRANQKGEGIEPISFNVNALTSGEMTLAGKMGEANKKTTAGQDVRLVDIPADAGQGLGIYEQTHGMTPQGLSDHLKQASSKYKGFAMEWWLTHLTSQTWEFLEQAIKPGIEAFKSRHLKIHSASGVVSGQVDRVLSYFAVQAAVGEYAITIGLLPWGWGTSIKAYDSIFNEWLENRGSSGESRESYEVKGNLKKLIQQDAIRFEAEGESHRGINKAGMRKGTLHYIFADVYKSEIIQGKNERVINKELIKEGILISDNGKSTTSKYVPGIGNLRVYAIEASLLEKELNPFWAIISEHNNVVQISGHM
jgi:putative DNA primase/helicase